MFPSPETATTAFSLKPRNPSYAVEGKDFTLKWIYSLHGNLNSAQFSKVNGTGNDPIGSRVGPGKINITQKYEAHFRAQAENTRAELTILAVQLSDEGSFELTVVSNTTGAFSSDIIKVIVLCKY